MTARRAERARRAIVAMMFAATGACSRPADKPAAPAAAATPAAAPAASASATGAPVYRVDPFFPKTLPNNWIVGQVAGLAVDAKDHVWIIQRPSSVSPEEGAAALKPPAAMCCVPAPPVIEFDGDGNVVQAWGGPGAGYEWFQVEHGIYVDPAGQRVGRRQRRQRQPRAEVHARRQVPAADRQVGAARRQQRQDDARRPRGGRSRHCGERGLHRRRLQEQARRRLRRDDRRVQAPLGRVRQRAGRRPGDPGGGADAQQGAVRPGGAAVAAVPRAGARGRAVARRARLRHRSHGQPRSGVPQERRVRQRGADPPGDAVAGDGLGRCAVTRCASRNGW